MSAWGWTLSVAVLSLVVALVVGSLMGILRTTPNNAWLVLLGNAWTELFRNIPLLVQIFLWYHVMPVDLPVAARRAELRAGRVRARLLHLGADRRAGARRHPGAAARASAMPAWRWASRLPQTYRYVLLPMAFRIIIPPLTSESMNIIKNSSVAFAVSIAELTMFAMQAQEETSRGIEIYLAVTALYFVSAFAINRSMALHREARRSVPGHDRPERRRTLT